MPTLTEQGVDYVFDASVQVSQYDQWSFQRNQFGNFAGGCKGVDFLAMPDGQTLWLIEAKNYLVHQRTKLSELPLEVALKVRDTPAGLAAARVRANDAAERRFAATALQATRMRVMLLLEQPVTPSSIKPTVGTVANLQQRLRQLVRAVDAHPVVDAGSGHHAPHAVALR